MENIDYQMENEKRQRKRKRLPRFVRRLAAVAALALALVLADIMSPYVKKWMHRILPDVDYHTAAVQLTHEMEKAGELIAVRYTDTGLMTGTIKALFVGSVGEVKAYYEYEIGLGIKLEDVKLTPEDGLLTVTVPGVQMMYDRFDLTGESQNSDLWDLQNKDFWGFSTDKRYQRLLDNQKAACRAAYLDDPQYMEKAWEAACEQIEALFRQWTGEELQLRFLREGE